jgi:PAS domain S-box-containing protein
MAKEQLLAQLKVKTAELQDVNEEIEVKNEELAAQSEELECANEELRTHNEELQTVTRSLCETQDYLESLINYANAPIIVWDTRFTITRFNQAFERLSGYTAKEVIGKDLSILFPADSREESLDKIKNTLEGEQWESVEIPILHKYGSIRIALWNSANIYGEEHALLATIAQGQDITRRKQAEKELEDAKAQAELYLDLMGHDISNLHQIMMMQLELATEILRAEGKLHGDDRELIDSSLRTLDKAARLINNVRKLQRHQSGEFSLEPVDLNLMLKDVLKDYSNLPGKVVTIKYNPGGKSQVRANPLLKDVFSNLIDNAVKHSSDPLVMVVNVSKVSQNGSAYQRVAIEDNGNGIPDDKKEEVFHRFKRGQTKARGTGLGLYIVKTLVESFGGYVEVQNRVLDDYTQGTRFLVYLPAMEEDDAGNE